VSALEQEVTSVSFPPWEPEAGALQRVRGYVEQLLGDWREREAAIRGRQQAISRARSTAILRTLHWGDAGSGESAVAAARDAVARRYKPAMSDAEVDAIVGDVLADYQPPARAAWINHGPVGGRG
jgi:hypothetical protein